MIYSRVVPAKFLSRPNRFIAHVDLEGETVIAHVKNTGRCKELLVPGAAVYLEPAQNPARKTPFDLIAVQKGGLLINMDAQAPNKVFAEWAQAGGIPDLTLLRPETTWGSSRFDFYFEAHGENGPEKGFVEVKGVTLEKDGGAFFPDAPTQRGVKHLKELIAARQQGYRAAICLVIQMTGVKFFAPNDATHPEFGEALRLAARSGVDILAYDCLVTPGTLEMNRPVELRL